MSNGASALWKTEDWWAVWFGLGIVLLALIVFWQGSTLAGWAVTPGKWSTVDHMFTALGQHLIDYLIIFLMFGIVFSLSMKIMGVNIGRFVPGFIVLFVGSLLIFLLAGWKIMKDINIEAPLLALIIGLIISNIFRIPERFRTALRTEYYIKTGIVLLGATLPLTLIFTAGPIAFLQATLVSVTTWLTIYLAATRLFNLEPQFGAVLGAGGAVCGVSASIAVGGAVRARQDHISIGIAVVTVWAIVMIFALTIALKQLVPDPISPGVAGAWVGTSEFADAAGFAVVAELATRFGDSPINTFTLMKVIGRDIWIGIWCLILSVVSVVFWEKEQTGGTRVGAAVVWQRFPKFVLGFLAASIIMSVVSSSVPGDHVGTAGWTGKYQNVTYSADFTDYRIPEALRHKMTIDPSRQTLSFTGKMSLEELKTLTAAASQDQVWALNELRFSSDWFASVLKPRVISPIKKLRSWAFVLCFLCIGLSTRFKDLMTFGIKPFWAFTVGVIVNVPLGFVLSTIVFVDYWSKI
ncbi:MAG: putative sulfate exporter family transporter [Candidatus Zixiibacteriota bacterium]